MSFQRAQGGVCAPKGFRAAGVEAGIKSSGGKDVALIVSDVECATAGTFTTNLAAAAPVLVSKSRLAEGSPRAVIVNSGCANACTGERGLADAESMADAAAAALGMQGSDVLVCSTGLIGSFLPMDAIVAGASKAAAALSAGGDDVAEAIMTTDTKPKVSALTHSDGWTIGGIAKGAGMIAPNMATMLAFITTDAVVDSRVLREVLPEIVEVTFNRISIDGDMSTNDTVLAFANGASGVVPDLEDFIEGLGSVCRSLAEQIVADGEGATRFVRVRVRGAASEEEAVLAGRQIASSLLVKTMLWSGDANWGRVAAVLGRAGIAFAPSKLSIAMEGVEVLAEGVPADDKTLARARAALKSPEVTIVCDLFLGDGAAEILTTDLTPEYIHLNAEYEA